MNDEQKKDEELLKDLNDQEATAEEPSQECSNCASMKKEREEYKQGWQRAVADYKNLQKESNERKAEWAQMSEQYILEEFIPVYDNFKKAFAATAAQDLTNADATNDTNKQWMNWKQGIEYIMRQFGEVLKAHNVEEIKTVGEKFDPKLHETAGEEAVDGKDPGTIIREIEGGYKMGDRIMKVAKVIIAK